MAENDSRQWHGSVTFRRWAEQPDDEVLAALARELPGYGVIVDNGVDRVRVEVTVQASTVRAACEAALRGFRAAYTTAVGATAPDVTAVRVVSGDDYAAELARPSQIDLVGKSEAAQMLRVSPQRVDELSRTNAAFPDPVAELKMGPVYTRASIEAFDQQWERRRTGRPRRQAG